MRINNELSDYNILLRSKNSNIGQALDPKNAAIFSIVAGIIAFLFGVGAFVLRALMRYKLGSRSFGLVTIFFCFIWIKWVESMYSIHLSTNKEASITDLIGASIKPVFDFLDGIFNLGGSSPSKMLMELFSFNLYKSGLLHWMAIAVLLIGLAHYIKSIIRDFRKEKWYSFHRGESWLFKWLIGKKLFNITITDTTVWLLIEPLFVFLIAIPFASVPEGESTAFVLKTSAICLFCQELTIYQKKKEALQDIIDQEIEAVEITQQMNQRKATAAILPTSQTNTTADTIV